MMNTTGSILGNLPAQSIAAVVVMPTYNNAATLGGILDRIHVLGLSMVVVNDGSTDATADLLRRRIAADSSGKLQVCTHPLNRGKAAALRTGFDVAAAHGFTHAITIDTDGQHAPEDIPALLAAAAREPRALVIGTRDESTAGYPSRSRLGRRLSNYFVKLESGIQVDDSQCGLRVYPLNLVTRTTCRAGHFGYETEIITRAGWAGIPVVGLGVSCTYLPPGRRVSHFKPWRDSARGAAMHLRLLTLTLITALIGAMKRVTVIKNTVPVRPVETVGG